ncbi:MAG: two-component system phosphate regulon sensor histidine kinase PhoR [Saprospiraceae bacterium]|jgi:two-component system phosphate regulon sensor histidine kinase PhoR
MNRTNIRLRLLSYGVIAYMLLAFLWWSVLLFNKNRDTFEARAEVLKIGMIAEGTISSPQDLLDNPRYQELSNSYRRQEWMIMGEGLFFIITLVIGIWLINRGYNTQVQAAQQRRNFLLSITHELKSPIASVRLVLETFKKRQLKPEMFAKLTENGLKETERLNNLVNDLLLSAKLDTDYQPHFEPLILDELLASLIEKLEAKYPNATFNFNCVEDIPVIEADKTGINSVTINLIENAVKYSLENPQIDIELREIGGNVELQIADRGIGISDKEKKKIFSKFYRVGNEDTRATKGTGLGLYIVQQTVKAHRGQISVSNNTPKGTIFTIVLPVGQKE